MEEPVKKTSEEATVWTGQPAEAVVEKVEQKEAPKLRGAVVVPGDKDEELHVLKPRTEPEHNPDFWAQVMGWDLLTGRKVSDFSIVEQYDVLLVNGNLLILPLIQRLKTHSIAKIIFLVEGSPAAVNYYKTEEKIEYINTVKMVDAIGTLGYSYDFFSLLSDKPVYWLGVPFDLKFVQSFTKNKRMKVKGRWAVGSNLNSHNSLVSLFVAHSAGAKQIWMQEFPEDRASLFCKSFHLSSVKLHQPLPWIDFLKEYSVCWGAVLLSNESTWGRYALDFAAMGLPVVGSKRQFTQQILFPTLNFDPYNEIEYAVRAVRRLQEDQNYYDRVINYAQQQLPLFDIPAARRRMECILEKIL